LRLKRNGEAFKSIAKLEKFDPLKFQEFKYKQIKQPIDLTAIVKNEINLRNMKNQASNLSMDDSKDPYANNNSDYQTHRVESRFSNPDRDPMSFSPDRKE
jgi:hypothetical protein